MQTSLFSIFLDYWCNFECQHCSVGSSPRTIMPMPRDVLTRAFEGLKQVPSARVVVFTGGEPTLRLEMLLEGIRMTKERGLLCRVVTNGWWASSEERADAMLGSLREAGLDEINTSYDDFHEPFMRIGRIVHLVRAARKLDMRVGMGVIGDASAKYNAATIRATLCSELGLTTKELDDTVVLLEDAPAPTGSGSELDVSAMDAAEKLDLGCPEVLKTVSLHPNGGVKACCGHAMFYAPDLTVGNLLEEDLPQILKRTQGNVLYWWLHMHGPKRILQRLGVEGRYSHICHACNELLTTHRKALIEYLAEHKDDVMLNDVLLSDNVRSAARLLLKQKSEIVAELEGGPPARRIIAIAAEPRG